MQGSIDPLNQSVQWLEMSTDPRRLTDSGRIRPQPEGEIISLFVWLVAHGRCWCVLREKYCWLVVDGWFVLREKSCWLVADKPSEQGA
jgi:hypothetical protein